MKSTRTLAATMTLAALVAGTVAVAPLASAKGSDAVRASGGCSGSATWKMKAKPDDGRIELELEVDSNRVGQVWSVIIKDNGVRVFSGTRTTLAPSGSFSVNKRVANRAGTDRFVGVATNVRSGQTCTARVSL